MRTPEFEFFALHADADNKHWSTERDSMSFSEKKRADNEVPPFTWGKGRLSSDTALKVGR